MSSGKFPAQHSELIHKMSPMAVEEQNVSTEDTEVLPRKSGPIRKFGVAIAGVAVILVGIPLIPLFGPGWLIVFTGLAILASEFAWAGRLRDNIRSRLRSFLARQSSESND